MIWRNVEWPLPKHAYEADIYLEAYERLKLEMDRLKKHEDEILFFSRELQCRRIINGGVRGLPISIYGFICNYGLSYIQPLIILFFVFLYGSIIFMFYYGNGGEWKAAGISLINTLGIFGFRREMFESGVFTSMPGFLKLFSGLQTILGSICLFFFGLSLRNRFRIK